MFVIFLKIQQIQNKTFLVIKGPKLSTYSYFLSIYFLWIQNLLGSIFKYIFIYP